MIERLRTEGGPLAICNLVNHDPGCKYPALIELLDLRDALLADLPWNYLGRALDLDKKDPRGKYFQHAQDLEKLGWDNLTFSNHYTIFQAYMNACAEDSAKRFYDQVQPFITERVGFSNSTGPARYALAWIDKDEKMELQALRDSATFSQTDLRTQAVHAILHNDIDGATRVLDASIERYPNAPRERALKEWLSLLPALLDSKHPDHERAIDAMPDGNLFLRWALAQQAGLSAEETARLFHNQTDGLEGVFAALAAGDKERFKALFSRFAVSGMERVVLIHESYKIFGSKPPKEQPDLRPPGAKPIQDLVREILDKQGGRK